MMTEPEYIKQLRLATAMLRDDKIDLEEFEEHCIAAAVCFRGPPPEGREYVVGIVGDRLIVGHVERKPLTLNQARTKAGFPYLPE